MNEVSHPGFEMPENQETFTTTGRIGNEEDKLVDIIYQQGIEKGKDDLMETLLRNGVDATITIEETVCWIEPNIPALYEALKKFNNGDKVKIVFLRPVFD